MKLAPQSPGILTFTERDKSKRQVFTVLFNPTKLDGVVEVHTEPICDERGFFSRTWCQEEFTDHNLVARVVQCSISFNSRRGTLRGMHYQTEPFEEAKLVRCTAGAVFDVALDLRRDSKTYKQWFGTILSAENRIALYVPKGCAHGFLTLKDNTEVFYQISEFYHPESARGVRWNDSAFQIEWPAEVEVISVRDRDLPDFG